MTSVGEASIWAVALAILGMSIVEYGGDSNLMAYANEGKRGALLKGAAFYVLMTFIIIQIFRMSNLIYINLMWCAISAISETLLAFFLLHERLHNNYQYAGGIMVVLGTVSLMVGKVPRTVKK